ncbi:MAG: AraC family transcriptional regulator [Butyrivibrio sp.]|nr:AraC family transcriptional regulator [Butyrivibrio sp.]
MIFINKTDTYKSQKDNSNISFLRKMVLSYSIILFVILFLGIFFYSSSIRTIDTRFWEQNETTLKQSSADLNYTFEMMDVLCGQIGTSAVQSLTYYVTKPDSFYMSAYTAQKDLILYMATETMLPITNYYIYLENTDYILSSSQFMSNDLFYKYERKYNMEQYENWYHLMHNRNNCQTFISMSQYINNSNPQSSYIYTLNLNNYSVNETNSMVVFEMDDKKLASIFADIDFYDDGFLVITDSEGNLMYSQNMYDESLVERISNLQYDSSNLASLELEGINMKSIHYVSTFNDWNYYLVLPKSAAIGTLHSYQIIYIIIISAAIIISFILIYFLSMKNSAPMIELKEQLSDMEIDNDTLKQVINEQKPLIQNAYARRVMMGQVYTEEELKYIRNYLGLSAENQRFNVLYMVIYDNEYINSPESETAFSAPIEIGENIIREAFTMFIGSPLYIFSPDERCYAVLLNTTEPDDKAMLNIQEKILKLHNYLLDNYSIWLYASVGRPKSNFMNLWRSYEQAVEAINYTTKNYIFIPHELIKKDSNEYYYPLELSQKLYSYIIHGVNAQVHEIFKIIRSENLEKRALPFNLMNFLFSDIRNTLFKARNAIKETPDKAENFSEIDSMFEQKLSLKLCEDIALRLCDLCKTTSNEEQLIVNIQKYINDNYKDPSLGLNKISEKFQISESYFSHMFKEETGTNFSTYLESIRMNESVRLIKSGEISNISDLYMVVGYNNANSFRRVFKKTFGISPAQMRDSAPLNN